MPRKSFSPLLVLAIVGLSSCKASVDSVPTDRAGVPATAESIPGAKLTRTEAIALSRLAAVETRKNMDEYRINEVLYSSETHEWAVLYEPIVSCFSCSFTIGVNDRTGSLRVIGAQ
jgi:hypothetical protein